MERTGWAVSDYLIPVHWPSEHNKSFQRTVKKLRFLTSTEFARYAGKKTKLINH